MTTGDQPGFAGSTEGDPGTGFPSWLRGVATAGVALLGGAALGAWGLRRGEAAVQRYYARTPPPGRWLHEDERPAFTPIWRESIWAAEWARLRWEPVYRGEGVPVGDGSAVALVPGFLANERYLAPLHGWLGRLGYRPALAEIGWNADCFDITTDRILARVERAVAETGRRVHLIGHSLGGILARAAAVRRPAAVASVVTLASPFRGLRDHRLLIAAANIVRGRIHRKRGAEVRPDCFTFACDCQTVRALAQPWPREVHQLAIYTRQDGAVDWRYCRTEEPGADVEVQGTHVGLVFNPEVYRALSRHFAGVSRETADVPRLGTEG